MVKNCLISGGKLLGLFRADCSFGRLRCFLFGKGVQTKGASSCGQGCSWCPVMWCLPPACPTRTRCALSWSARVLSTGPPNTERKSLKLLQRRIMAGCPRSQRKLGQKRDVNLDLYALHCVLVYQTCLSPLCSWLGVAHFFLCSLKSPPWELAESI